MKAKTAVLLHRVRQRDRKVGGDAAPPAAHGIPSWSSRSAEGVGGREGGVCQGGLTRRQAASDRRSSPTDAGAPLSHRHGRAGPGARRGSRQGLAGAGGRRARHRQIHADAADLQSSSADFAKVLYVSGEESRAPAQAARRAAPGGERQPLCALGDLSGRCAGMLSARKQPDVLIVDSIQTLIQRGAGRRPQAASVR